LGAIGFNSCALDGAGGSGALTCGGFTGCAGAAAWPPGAGDCGPALVPDWPPGAVADGEAALPLGAAGFWVSEDDLGAGLTSAGAV
jgi:hypothetical protein